MNNVLPFRPRYKPQPEPHYGLVALLCFALGIAIVGLWAVIP